MFHLGRQDTLFTSPIFLLSFSFSFISTLTSVSNFFLSLSLYKLFFFFSRFLTRTASISRSSPPLSLSFCHRVGASLSLPLFPPPSLLLRAPISRQRLLCSRLSVAFANNILCRRQPDQIWQKFATLANLLNYFDFI